jgi:hypothetical protein
MASTQVNTPFRLSSSLAARSNGIDLQKTVTNYEQMAQKTYNVPPVYSTTDISGRPSSFETLNSSTSMAPTGITAIDSSSSDLELTLGTPPNNGTQKEFFLLYTRSSPVTVTYNDDETLTLYGSNAYYKLLYIDGTWINLANQ